MKDFRYLLILQFFIVSSFINAGSSNSDCWCWSIFILLIIIWLINKKAKEEESERMKRERERMKRERERIERERKMDSDKIFLSWESKPWRDRTKNIIKTKAKLIGRYDFLKNVWHHKKMKLWFEYEKEYFGFDLDYSKCMEIQNNKPFTAQVKINERIIRLFFYENNWYYTHAEISLDDAIILIEATKKYNKEKLQREIERSRNLLKGQDNTPHRQSIPDSVKSFVWNRDGGKCVKCGSRENLEFDHIIPLSKGGSNTARNIQLLCEKCNRQKGNKFG